MKKNKLSNSKLNQIICEIVAINRGWKVAKDLFGENADLSVSLRELKNSLQIRLLRTYQDQVYIVFADDSEDEDLFSIRIDDESVERSDAEHLPVRVAKQYFTEEEIGKFLRNA